MVFPETDNQSCKINTGFKSVVTMTHLLYDIIMIQNHSSFNAAVISKGNILICNCLQTFSCWAWHMKTLRKENSLAYYNITMILICLDCFNTIKYIVVEAVDDKSLVLKIIESV